MRRWGLRRPIAERVVDTPESAPEIIKDKLNEERSIEPISVRRDFDAFFGQCIKDVGKRRH